MLAFADPVIGRMLRDEFIAVTGDDWYQRRRKDREGDFFRDVARQANRKTGTLQGIYAFTATGKLLAARNHQEPDAIRELLQKALNEWRKLSAEQRRPGAVTISSWGTPDREYVRTPPPGGLTLKVFTRILDRDARGALARGSCTFTGGDQAARDNFWLTEPEWKSLIPDKAAAGDTVPVPERLAQRLIRFHLVDNTRGEPGEWSRSDVRKRDLKLVVEQATPQQLRLRLQGSVLLATNANLSRADRGFDVNLRGSIHYDRSKGRITHFDVVALGDHWGDGPYTPDARPGRKPLGIVMELATGDAPADHLPPQGARWLPGYLEAEKH